MAAVPDAGAYERRGRMGERAGGIDEDVDACKHGIEFGRVLRLGAAPGQAQLPGHLCCARGGAAGQDRVDSCFVGEGSDVCSGGAGTVDQKDD